MMTTEPADGVGSSQLTTKTYKIALAQCSPSEITLNMSQTRNALINANSSSTYNPTSSLIARHPEPLWIKCEKTCPVTDIRPVVVAYILDKRGRIHWSKTAVSGPYVEGSLNAINGVYQKKLTDNVHVQFCLDKLAFCKVKGKYSDYNGILNDVDSKDYKQRCHMFGEHPQEMVTRGQYSKEADLAITIGIVTNCGIFEPLSNTVKVSLVDKKHATACKKPCIDELLQKGKGVLAILDKNIPLEYRGGFCLQVQDKNSELLGTFLASSEKPGRRDRVYGDPTELDPRLINTPVYVTVVDCTGNSITEKKQCTILYSASGCGKEEASKLATEVHSKQYATMPKKDTEDRETALDHELAEVIRDRQPNRNDHDDETELSQHNYPAVPISTASPTTEQSTPLDSLQELRFQGLRNAVEQIDEENTNLEDVPDLELMNTNEIDIELLNELIQDENNGNKRMKTLCNGANFAESEENKMLSYSEERTAAPWSSVDEEEDLRYLLNQEVLDEQINRSGASNTKTSEHITWIDQDKDTGTGPSFPDAQASTISSPEGEFSSLLSQPDNHLPMLRHLEERTTAPWNSVDEEEIDLGDMLNQEGPLDRDDSAEAELEGENGDELLAMVDEVWENRREYIVQRFDELFGTDTPANNETQFIPTQPFHVSLSSLFADNSDEGEPGNKPESDRSGSSDAIRRSRLEATDAGSSQPFLSTNPPANHENTPIELCIAGVPSAFTEPEYETGGSTSAENRLHSPVPPEGSSLPYTFELHQAGQNDDEEIHSVGDGQQHLHKRGAPTKIDDCNSPGPSSKRQKMTADS